MGDDDFRWRSQLARAGQTLLRAITISPFRTTRALTPRSDRAGVLNVGE
jgi:hypothetical protein